MKAPFSRPNSSLSMSPAGSAAQLTFTITCWWRGLSRWMACATRSLPVPVSPSTSTVDVVGRDLLDLAQHLLDGRALPGDLAVHAARADLDLEVVALGLEPVLQLFDFRERPPQRLLGASALRDVAEDTVTS